MPLVHQLLITLRSLMEDEPQQPHVRKRRRNSGGKSNRSRKTTALVLTFRDLFRSGGLNLILDEMDTNRKPIKKNMHNTFSMSVITNSDAQAVIPVATQPTQLLDTKLAVLDQNAPITLPRLIYQDETMPLLQDDSTSVLCTDLVPRPRPVFPSGLFSRLAFIRHRQKNVTVSLNPEDENKTVATLKKVLKWSPRKQNSATFAVSLPEGEKHVALAVVENAVNRVKEEQLTRKKKKKFLWLKFC